MKLVNSGWLDDNYALGDLQSVFLDFKRICLEYRYYLQLQHIAKKQELLREQINKNNEFRKKQLAQLGNLLEDTKFQEKDYERDSILYENDILSQTDLEQSFRSLIQKRNSRESLEASITNTDLSILQKEQQLIELEIQREQEITTYEREIKKSEQQLITQIDTWKHQYVVTSPIKGKAVFSKYWANNQAVDVGERLATVIPANSSNIIARLTVPTSGFGKVEKGQIVNVKLNGYPYMEYGILKGYIKNIADVPEPEGYIVEVIFPNGLITTYNKNLNMIQEMDGTAEIITKDERLIERFIQPIRALLNK